MHGHGGLFTSSICHNRGLLISVTTQMGSHGSHALILKKHNYFLILSSPEALYPPSV